MLRIELINYWVVADSWLPSLSGSSLKLPPIYTSSECVAANQNPYTEPIILIPSSSAGSTFDIDLGRQQSWRHPGSVAPAVLRLLYLITMMALVPIYFVISCNEEPDSLLSPTLDLWSRGSLGVR